MMKPFPTQITGAQFLASRQAGMLADAPRVGKTGAAIIAADLICAERILVVTTASGRPVWKRGFADWSVFDRTVTVITKLPKALNPGVTIVGWPSVSEPKLRALLLAVEWDLLILDEEHAAKNFSAKRTQAVYGTLLEDGARLSTVTAIGARAKRVWPLTGTPFPHDLSDTYPRLRALAPERLAANPDKGWPDVLCYNDFLHRYCVVKMKQISQFNRIPVVIGGRNEAELQERMRGFWLRRTQADVGIRPPSYSIFPLMMSKAQSDFILTHEQQLDRALVLNAIVTGETHNLEMHLGPLRRLTGEVKAKTIVEAVEDEFNGGLDKLVIMYWHKGVGDELESGLAKYGVVRLDGSTPPKERETAEARFRDKKNRVFLGQIVAAGEAIDLSAASELWFAESSFSPKDMAQAALRVTNYEQTRNVFVRVCALTGSIDEALQAALLRLWATINKVNA
jgi:SWI/SNF-related matrix-associated actin-dependent regulator 1 of chromatin subfamily A